jgi:topoisomerase-4 subunit A
MAIDDDSHDRVTDRRFADALGERYLSYALSTIMARSLPDVRDGLKPVHRRLLFAMRGLRLGAATMPKKCARVVGDVIGRYHPHGDQAVYDALVRLAQDFAVRYPLIDGQGNFGNIDGDNAAAMRYTEARLTETAERLLEGIEDDAVDFRDTYDGDGQEPVVLPGAFPNLLANGATGIAVGMATNIPPHNAWELCQGLTLLLDREHLSLAAERTPVSIDELVSVIPGPDFPTGGVLVEERSATARSYATGRGALRVRARWQKETLGQGTWQIIVTEIPYQVQKSRLIERIAELINQRKVPLLDDVRDESAEVVRLVLVPKSRNVDPNVLMEQLFRSSDLETRFNLNMNVLEGGHVPRVMDLKGVLNAFLWHRRDVLGRRTRHRLGKIEVRLEILGGLLIAYLNIDEVIRIIREEDEPKRELIVRFTLTGTQAEAILNMRLRNLRKLEEFEIQAENERLLAEQADLTDLLSSQTRQWGRIRADIGTVAEAYGPETELGRRRTVISEAPVVVDVPMDARVEREPITVVLSTKGWLRALKGHGIEPKDLRFKDGDGLAVVLFFISNGRFFTLGADKLAGGRGFGEPIRLQLDIPQDAEIVTMMKLMDGENLLVIARDGRGFQVKAADVVAQTKAGKQVLNVGKDGRAFACVPISGDHVAVYGGDRKLLAFPIADIPEMTRGRGVVLQKYGARDRKGLISLTVFALAEGLSWPAGERTRTQADMSAWLGKRGQVGKKPPHGYPPGGHVR